MIYALPFQAVVGLLQRRNWGGWEKIDPAVAKKVFGFMLPTLVALLITFNVLAGLAFGLLIGLAYMNPFHGWAQGMGTDPTKPLWKCVLVWSASYGLMTTLAAVAVILLTGDVGYWHFALHGFLTPLAAVLARFYWPSTLKVWNTGQRYNPETGVLEDQWFIDGATAVGECWIGALLLTL